jgi:PTS system nitrogen regulatory IIA component
LIRKAGGIFYRVDGTDKESVLRSVVDLMRLPDQVDREFLLQILLERESLGSTAIGEGIAIPHVRNPIVLHVARPAVTLCFLENPIDFGALDGQPVKILFALISPSIRSHLHILSRLTFALRDPVFKQGLLQQDSREVIFREAGRIEAMLSPAQPQPLSGKTG